MEPKVFAALFLVLATTHAARIKAKDSGELIEALTLAKPGDTIQLLPIIYEGNFLLPGGTHQPVPIRIDGKPNPRSSKTATLKGTNTTVVDIKGGKWILQSLEIIGGGTGISVTGDGHQLTALTIYGFSTQGISIKGSGNRVAHITTRGNGTGIQVDGRQNSLTNVTVEGSKNGIVIFGQRNRLTRITTQMIKRIGILIGRESGNTVGTTITVDGGKYGLFIDAGASGGRYTNLKVNQGLLQVEGGNNRFTTATVNSSGVNILSCGNTFITSIISKLYQANQCNMISLRTTKIGEIVSSSIPAADDEQGEGGITGDEDYKEFQDADGNFSF